MRYPLLLALLLGAPLAALPAQSEKRTVPVLTVEDALRLARERHPALAAASARRQAATGQARQDAAFPNPVLEWRREHLDSPLARDEFTTVVQPLDLTGRRFALRSAASLTDRRTVADSATVARNVEMGAARAFWRSALAREVLAAATDHRAATDRLAAFEADRAREGAVAEVVAMRTRLEADRARLAEATARAESHRAAADLANALGTTVDELPALAPFAPRALDLAPPPDLAAAQARAVERRSELVALRAAVQAARARLTAERRGTLPDVVLQAGTKKTGGYDTRVIGIGVPLPLFNANGGARERAQGELRLAEAELRAAETAVRNEVATAIDGYRALLASAPPGADSLAAHASSVAGIIEAAYTEGGVSLLELLEAQRTRADTRVAALRWFVELHLARLELGRATGAPALEPTENP